VIEVSADATGDEFVRLAAVQCVGNYGVECRLQAVFGVQVRDNAGLNLGSGLFERSECAGALFENVARVFA
jgi:hypothetical protein